ncbi:ATP-dependent DNA ligase [Streptomyces flavotricini]|uniref:ATP-dependent DNA ligase n=1 Tax=Streptomyces flavotricini TaxID=66888 RepID=UPI003556ADFF
MSNSAQQKFDGHRTVLRVTDETVVLYARSGRVVTALWMDLALAAQRSLRPGTVLDGEAVIWRKGALDSSAVQARAASTSARARAVEAGLQSLGLLDDCGEESVATGAAHLLQGCVPGNGPPHPAKPVQCLRLPHVAEARPDPGRQAVAGAGAGRPGVSAAACSRCAGSPSRPCRRSPRRWCALRGRNVVHAPGSCTGSVALGAQFGDRPMPAATHRLPPSVPVRVAAPRGHPHGRTCHTPQPRPAAVQCALNGGFADDVGHRSLP